MKLPAGVILILFLLMNGFQGVETDLPKYEYGVFLGLDSGDVRRMEDYETIVVEGQLFTKDEVRALKEKGHRVFSYINVGALENYRSYYDDYEEYTLDVYENWEDERWVDVSARQWQDFLIEDLAADMKEKGFDGLFVDNLDVYYHYKTKKNFKAITRILKAFKDYGFYVSINGGDVYVTECIKKYKDPKEYFDAVNHETVFSRIIWEEEDCFDRQSKKERKYFQRYLSNVKSHGLDVYLLEYTKDEELVEEIRDYCDEMGYVFYVSETLNLE